MSLLSVIVLATVTAGEPSLDIIPRPDVAVRQSGSFTLNQGTVIVPAKGAEKVAHQLKNYLVPSTGMPLNFRDQGTGNSFIFELDDTLKELGNEGYKLAVTRNRVTISSSSEIGLFYGVQTVRQMLPAENLSSNKQNNIEWKIPCVRIEDKPRFKWRGLMMDVARHYTPQKNILKMIDTMALHKLNSLHIHLTDDQGWRVEVKKYPKLTELGSKRKETVIGRNTSEYDGIPHGGFYTQEELKEVVAYAKERHINVVPEIDMPGHMVAAISAYPELGDGKPAEVMTRWGVSSRVLNTSDQTVQFCKDVLTEVMDIFPSEFIHIGGDECPKTQWENDPTEKERMDKRGLKDTHELQSWFIQQMDTFLVSKGRRLIGWDEILEGGLAENATVMSWRGVSGGITAAKQGHDVVMSPTSHMYLDYYQGSPETEPLAIGGNLPLERVYSFEPIPDELDSTQSKHILGVQGNLWAEYMKTFDHMEYMAFPRACAIAEIGWVAKDSKDYNHFFQRLETHVERLKNLGVNFRKPEPPKIAQARWVIGSTSEEFQTTEWTISNAFKSPGDYKVTFQYTDGAHRLDIEWAELIQNNKTLSRDTHEGITGGMTKDNSYFFKNISPKQNDKFVLRASIRSDGGTESAGNIFVELIK